MVPARALATAGAMDLLRRLRGMHGGLMMHQSGGCCDGSSPMCYPAGEFIVGDRDVLLGLLDLRLAPGEVPASLSEGDDAVPLWISGSQFDVWSHTQLVLDVVPGRGGGFSLESPEGMRFLTRGRVFTDEERSALASDGVVTGADWEAGRRPPVPGESTVVAEASEACPVPGR